MNETLPVGATYKKWHLEFRNSDIILSPLFFLWLQAYNKDAIVLILCYAYNVTNRLCIYDYQALFVLPWNTWKSRILEIQENLWDRNS